MHSHQASSFRLGSLIACAALALGACQRSPSEPPAVRQTATQPAPNAPTTAGAPSGAPHPFGDLHGAAPGSAPMLQPPSAPAGSAAITWTDPPAWQREAPSSAMRRAQYRIPRTGSDNSDGELVVFYFGSGQGGDVESNLARWYGQLQQPDGHATADVATRRTMTVGAYNITIAEATGRLGGAAMPGMPASPQIEHGRLLGAIVETPEGPWFFKLTGPDATVAAARPAFEQMLQSVHAGS